MSRYSESLLALVSMVAVLLIVAFSVGCASTPREPPLPQQMQASALAAPAAPAEYGGPMPAQATSAVVVVRCHKLIGLVVAGSHGDLHPVDISALTSAQITGMLDALPSDNVISMDVPCTAEMSTQNGA